VVLQIGCCRLTRSSVHSESTAHCRVFGTLGISSGLSRLSAYRLPDRRGYADRRLPSVQQPYLLGRRAAGPQHPRHLLRSRRRGALAGRWRRRRCREPSRQWRGSRSRQTRSWRHSRAGWTSGAPRVSEKGRDAGSAPGLCDGTNGERVSNLQSSGSGWDGNGAVACSCLLDLLSCTKDLHIRISTSRP
jgi:hypothetical protein